jgi:hypothetical protein
MFINQNRYTLLCSKLKGFPAESLCLITGTPLVFVASSLILQYLYRDGQMRTRNSSRSIRSRESISFSSTALHEPTHIVAAVVGPSSASPQPCRAIFGKDTLARISHPPCRAARRGTARCRACQSPPRPSQQGPRPRQRAQFFFLICFPLPFFSDHPHLPALSHKPRDPTARCVMRMPVYSQVPFRARVVIIYAADVVQTLGLGDRRVLRF